ncbi:MAG: lipopolysaccharide heptosyltransferase II [bacterium]
MRIAFRAPNWLGDAVLATVVPPALRRAHPEASLDVLAPAQVADVYAGRPDVDRVVAFAPGREVDAYRSGGYDRALLAPVSFGSAWRAARASRAKRFGFATSGRGWLLAAALPKHEWRRDRHQVENYRALASLLGEPRETDAPQVVVAAPWREEAERLWSGRARPRVALQPGATYGPAKRWSASRFAEVARSLAARGCAVAVVGGAGDAEAVRAVRDAAPVLDLGGRTSVGVLAAVLQSCDLVVTNDTGPMHLAAAVGTPTVAIFGSTSPAWTRPWGEGHRVARRAVACSPCYRRDCRIGYLCLEGVETSRVIEASLASLAAGRKGAR